MKTQVLYGNKVILLSQMELIFFFAHLYLLHTNLVSTETTTFLHFSYWKFHRTKSEDGLLNLFIFKVKYYLIFYLHIFQHILKIAI